MQGAIRGLVGDALRAQQITRQLLEAIRARYARVAVIDVTSVAGAGEGW